VRLLILNESSQTDIEAAFATLVRERAGAVSLRHPVMNSRRSISYPLCRIATPSAVDYRR